MKRRKPPKPDIHRLIELQRLTLRLHLVERACRHPGNFDRRETDTEHSFTLAMAAWFLAEHFPKLNRLKLIELALAHDIVEVYAGDTVAYAEAATLEGKSDREQAALTKLEREWADFPGMLAAIHEYKSRESPEAIFIYALDKLMPITMSYLEQGKAWRHEGVTFDKFLAQKEPRISLSPEVYDYYQQMLAIVRNHLDYFARPAGET